MSHGSGVLECKLPADWAFSKGLLSASETELSEGTFTLWNRWFDLLNTFHKGYIPTNVGHTLMVPLPFKHTLSLGASISLWDRQTRTCIFSVTIFRVIYLIAL